MYQLSSRSLDFHCETGTKTKTDYSISLGSLSSLLLAILERTESPFFCCYLGKGGKNRKRGKNQDEERVKRDLIFKEYLQGLGFGPY